MTFASCSVLAASCALVLFAVSPRAQQGMPQPSPELKKLEPLLGSWTGSGAMTLTETGKEIGKWTASRTYRQVLGGFWIQEDFAITSEDNTVPFVTRAYRGWDRERKTFVIVSVNNLGEAEVCDFTLQPDGTLLQMMVQNGVVDHTPLPTCAVRSLLRVDGETMTETIDMLRGKGPSMKVTEGKFTRQDAESPSVLDAKGAGPGEVTPQSMMGTLARLAGSYDAKCDLVMKPGAPAVKIVGVDTWRPIFGGQALHARTDAAIEGTPAKYECDAFWAWSGRKSCLVLIAVNNLGAVGVMEANFTDDVKALVATRAMTMEGQPAVVRTVIGFDDWQLKTIVSHLMVGTSAPFEHFTGTFTKK